MAVSRWPGTVQTYLASHALVILMVKLQPDWAEWANKDLHGFLGLSVLGYIAFAILWVVQALVFWRGMESIRKFIDFCGPAVYIVMAVLAIYLVSKAGWENVDLNLSDHQLTGFAVFSTFCAAVATTVSYFSGPMLNFGDISRYGKSQKAVKVGNFLGLPLNFLVFSVMVVLTASATVPVYGRMITDPVDTIAELDNTFAIAFGALTLLIATVGINIVANFIAPAFDFSTVAPKMISWRMGGMIAAVGSIFLTPWNLYNSPETIHYTLDTLAAFIGPVFGVLIAYFYVINRGDLNIPALFDSSPLRRLLVLEGLQRELGHRHLRGRGRGHRHRGRPCLRGRRHLHLVHRGDPRRCARHPAGEHPTVGDHARRHDRREGPGRHGTHPGLTITSGGGLRCSPQRHRTATGRPSQRQSASVQSAGDPD